MKRSRSILVVVSGVALFAGTAMAADVSQDAIDACIDALRADSGGGGGGRVLGTEFSEANSLVMLQDAGGGEWRCIVSNDGRSPYLERQGAAASSGAGSGSEPASWRIAVNGTLNVRAAPCTTAAIVARLPSGITVENRGCREAEGRTWCEIADGDATGWAAREFLAAAGMSGESAMADDGGGAMAGAPPTDTEVVRFGAGRTGTDLAGTLAPGTTRRYVLGAGSGQKLYVEFWTTDPAIDYQVFHPDGSALTPLSSNVERLEVETFLAGDHVIEVVDNSDHSAGYNLSVEIN